MQFLQSGLPGLLFMSARPGLIFHLPEPINELQIDEAAPLAMEETHGNGEKFNLLCNNSTVPGMQFHAARHALEYNAARIIEEGR